MKRRLLAASATATGTENKEEEVKSTTGQYLSSTSKRLRSTLRRRRRLCISPVVRNAGVDSHASDVSEISCVSRVSSNRRGDRCPQLFTRSYSRRKWNENRNCDESSQLSESSFVESCSRSGIGFKLKLKSEEVSESDAQSVVQFSKSEVSHASSLLSSETVAENESYVDVNANWIVAGEQSDSRLGFDVSDAENENSIGNCAASRIGETVTEEETRIQGIVGLNFDLACSENLTKEEFVSADEAENENSTLSSKILSFTSESAFDSSDYTPSFWSYASGSQFSEKSIGDERSSPTYELLVIFRTQFNRSSFALQAHKQQDTLQMDELGLEDSEEEERYRMIRKRERRQRYVYNYVEEYCNTAECGEFIVKQRLHMVHWIVEQATIQELRMETIFLGVNLLDRFLSKGYFKSVRNLQIAAIACLTLATRLEENQPYNCIRKHTFHVENTRYSRFEVVAMEWLVQEVLNFECYLPTSYNFLWFYLKAARANESVEKTAKYLAVLTLMSQQLLCFWPSTVAAGLVFISSIAMNQDASCNRLSAIHARQKDGDLPNCIKSMEWLVKYI